MGVKTKSALFHKRFRFDWRRIL